MELYRLSKEYGKDEQLYPEAIEILEKSFEPIDILYCKFEIRFLFHIIFSVFSDSVHFVRANIWLFFRVKIEWIVGCIGNMI